MVEIKLLGKGISGCYRVLCEYRAQAKSKHEVVFLGKPKYIDFCDDDPNISTHCLTDNHAIDLGILEVVGVGWGNTVSGFPRNWRKLL